MEAQLRGAAADGDLPTVRRFLQQPGGFNVNAGARGGWTALHFAVSRGHLPIVQAILQVDGVNVNARSVAGRTPLHEVFYCCANQVAIIQAMLEAGADPNVADTDGNSPLHFVSVYKYLSRNSHIRSWRALLDAGADPAARNNDLDTPLHRVCYWGRLEVIQLLIRRQGGSECLTLKNIREETPLDVLGVPRQSRSEVRASIGQHLLQSYAGMIAQRHGLLCLHSVLQDAAFTDVADDGDDEDLFQLPVGTLNTEQLQMLLGFLIAAEPGSIRTVDVNGLLPLYVASQLNFPDLVLNVLLRPFPAALPFE